MTGLLAGVDIGTTHLKAGVFDAEGHLHSAAQRECSPDYLPDGRVEVDPEKWWTAFGQCFAECLEPVDRKQLRALSVSSQAQTFVRLNARGKPVAPAVSWLDTRGDAEAIAAEVPLESYYVHTGLPRPTPLLASCKLRALAREPGAWSDTRTLVFPDGMLMHRLTGRAGVSRNIASMSGLYSMMLENWWRPALRAARVPEHVLPRLLEIGQPLGTLKAAVARRFGVPAVPVVAGANDQTAAAIGAGLCKPGMATLGMGTAFVLYQVIEEDAPSLPSFPFRGPYLDHMHWQLSLCNTAGGAIDWARSVIAGDCAWDQFFSEALQAEPGSAGARFDPDWDGSGGSVSRLGLGHTRQHFIRAVLEGVACATRALFDELTVNQTVRATGGGSSNENWIQLLADFSGRAIEQLDQPHVGLWGTALMAGHGAGLFDDLPAAAHDRRPQGRTFTPRPGFRAEYDRVYSDYLAFRRLRSD